MAPSVFRGADSGTLKAVADFNQLKRPNMILTNAFMNAEQAKLSYLLDRLAGPGRFYSFFANSTLEALAGAIKLARHASVRRRRADAGRVLFLEDTPRYAPFFDPVGTGPERALVPGVHVVSDAAAALTLLERREWAAVILVRTRCGEEEERVRAALLDRAARRGTLRIVCNSELDLWEPGFFAGPPADVHVLGENLTERQVPFGCFLMSEPTYEVWNNARDSLAHTSTFGGNGLCLSVVLDALRRHGHVDATAAARLDRIDLSMRERVDTFRDHVNPVVAQGMEMSGFALEVVEADGARLTLGDGTVVLDCAGGGGVSMRGHNPPDLVDGVLTGHEPGADHFAALEGLLARLTSFPHAFPAVSGATAVDVAVSLGLMAGAPRTRVVTFTGNFSGKTLISLNLSKYGQQHTESDREAFRPYYFDLVYVDPFAPGAAARFEEEVRGGEVALVWLEVIQGMMCRPLPGDLLAAVARLKDEHGYLIGVDEVLTGGWRTGIGFLAHPGVIPNADVVTLAKPLSDTTLPMGAALVTGEVLRRATARDGEHVERLRHHYRNALSAHIAVHALQQAVDPAVQEERARCQRILEEGLAEVAARSRLFDRVAGTGGLLRLVLRRRWFPFGMRSQLGQLLEAGLSAMIMRDCGLLVMQLRFFPRVLAKEDEVRRIVDELRRGTRRYTPLTVYRFVAGQVLSFVAAQIAHGVKESLRERRRRRAKPGGR
ncbi:aminotransferase class III-fold pyridoxal phosphate-dependent enzyme [Nonomuraea sp. NPDC050691]|uniref:aminotransferase class III-fold pyridoxal phosphate-dependent enzyme n=1 Tax=Nonomuraea sp. NPDC050691 TaxID=3155661 RepID=UPI0033D43621